MQADTKEIKLKLTCAADPEFYDLPLTLRTQVPAGWKECQVTQGTRKTMVTAAQGTVQFEAVPGAETVSLQPQTTSPTPHGDQVK
ncbi:MAG: hypothetical protein WCI73_08155 [Phycisphaerae bacterium]